MGLLDGLSQQQAPVHPEGEWPQSLNGSHSTWLPGQRFVTRYFTKANRPCWKCAFSKETLNDENKNVVVVVVLFLWGGESHFIEKELMT